MSTSRRLTPLYSVPVADWLSTVYNSTRRRSWTVYGFAFWYSLLLPVRWRTVHVKPWRREKSCWPQKKCTVCKLYPLECCLLICRLPRSDLEKKGREKEKKAMIWPARTDTTSSKGLGCFLVSLLLSFVGKTYSEIGSWCKYIGQRAIPWRLNSCLVRVYIRLLSFLTDRDGRFIFWKKEQER